MNTDDSKIVIFPGIRKVHQQVMIPTWSVIRSELARERAVAKKLVAQGYKVCELIEVRFKRASRRAKRRHMVEVNALPGKVIALVPEIDIDQMGDLPFVLGVARSADGRHWAIPEPQIAQFAENLTSLNSGELAGLIAEAERENQARQGKKKRVWVKLKDAGAKLLQTGAAE